MGSRKKERKTLHCKQLLYMDEFFLVYGSTVCIVGAAITIAMLTGVNTLHGPVQQRS